MTTAVILFAIAGLCFLASMCLFVKAILSYIDATKLEILEAINKEKK